MSGPGNSAVVSEQAVKARRKSCTFVEHNQHWHSFVSTPSEPQQLSREFTFPSADVSQNHLKGAALQAHPNQTDEMREAQKGRLLSETIKNFRGKSQILKKVSKNP
jgi:hypothetical protein